MFDPVKTARVFGLPPGVDFTKLLVEGLIERAKPYPPDHLARTTLIVNTRRMARRVKALFDQSDATFLPRLITLTDIPNHWGPLDFPPTASAVQRRLDLAQLITKLLEKEPELAPRSSLFDLADSLALLMDEMRAEDVSLENLKALDLTDHALNWARMSEFLQIIAEYDARTSTDIDPETRQAQTVRYLEESWQKDPIKTPVVLAGSTGSRGATQRLMKAVSMLPQGAVLLPGLDYDMDSDLDPMLSEDHPQYRHHAFLKGLSLTLEDTVIWKDVPPPNVNRNRLISLALRPAPATDQWLREGPNLGDLTHATHDITLLSAPTKHQEAMAIAMGMRQAAHDGRSIALITPDRTLTRSVTAQLSRWNITPDDSAGTPLHLTTPGRLMRHVLDLYQKPLTSELLMILLKHPLTHQGPSRGDHLRYTRELELYLRKNGKSHPSADDFDQWGDKINEDGTAPWISWLKSCFLDKELTGSHGLSFLSDIYLKHLHHITRSQSTIFDPDKDPEMAKVIETIHQISNQQIALSAGEFAQLIHQMLSSEDKRQTLEPHPNVLIWGTLEARVQGPDLVILAGLIEGTWPKLAKPDHWLNRDMRKQVGLLLPERQIGLSAHDFQQASCAPEIWLCHVQRNDDGQTIQSRWLRRLENLMNGLPTVNGPECLEQMKNRGQAWLDRVDTFEAVEPVPRVPRPAPQPPSHTRPKQLSVTEIERLIRDPYAVYAKHVLGLKPLNPLTQTPDARLRGILLHDILDKFITKHRDAVHPLTVESLTETADRLITQNVPSSTHQVVWKSFIEKHAENFITEELERQVLSQPIKTEVTGSIQFQSPEFTLTAKADRIDQDRNSRLSIYDYKTSSTPTPDQQTHFNKQLLLEALIAQEGGFENIDPSEVARAVYISFSNKNSEAQIDPDTLKEIREGLLSLVASYLDPKMGYQSRRAMLKMETEGDYDHLSRFGEWSQSDDPTKIALT